MSALPVLGFVFLIILAIFLPRTILAILIGVTMQRGEWWAFAGMLSALGLFVDYFSIKKWFT